MNAKLTLSMDTEIIKKAKKKLQTKDSSLSSIVENYFRVLTDDSILSNKSMPIVDSITGIVQINSTNFRKDHKLEYLLGKYK